MLVDWRVDTWICELRLNRTDYPSEEDHVLAIGGSPVSSTGYDPGIDLQILPTIPSIVNAHIVLEDDEYPWMTELRRDLRDLTPPHRWLIPTFDESNGVIRWNPDVLPEGKFYINGLIDMKLDSIAYFGLNDTIVIDWLTPPLGIDILSLSAGWNMISLPVQPPRYHPREVFSHTSVGLYKFKTGERRYVEADMFEKGEAYWCYSPCDTSFKIGGIILDEYSRNIKRGWNMVAAIGELQLCFACQQQHPFIGCLVVPEVGR